MLAHVVTSDRSSSGRQVVELQALMLPLGVVLSELGFCWGVLCFRVPYYIGDLKGGTPR